MHSAISGQNLWGGKTIVKGEGGVVEMIFTWHLLMEPSTGYVTRAKGGGGVNFYDKDDTIICS